MTIGEAKALVTTEAFYRRKVEPWRNELASLQHRLPDRMLGTSAAGNDRSSRLPWRMLGRHSTTVRTAPRTWRCCTSPAARPGGRKAPCMSMKRWSRITSPAASRSICIHDDIFWCTADPGWVTGTSYGIISPLTNGATLIVDQAEFDAERWYRILEEQKVTVWYTAPTAIRMLMKAGADFAKRFDLSSLRFMASVGEPLNPEAVVWGVEAFGKPFHDNWWQTETGGIMIANYRVDGREAGLDGPAAARDRRPASSSASTAGEVREITKPMAMGELALRPGWPSMMRGYLNEEERYRKCFVGGWYLTGDLAMRDDDGYYWFVGRADDVIKSAGHLIGPFEVESALMEHPAVAEAGVIGIPDPTAGEVVKAFVALKDGFEPSEPLRKELLGHARKRLGPAVAPKDIAFRQNLAEDPQRQDHAPPAQGARTRPAGGRHFDAGKRGAMSSTLDKPHLSREHVLDLLRQMIRIRRFEEKCAELYTQEKIRGFLHLYDGEEAVAVGVIPVLEERDRIVATYREHGHALVRGVPMTTVLAEMYGKQEGCSGGRGGSMHLFDRATNFYGGNAIVGGGLPLAVGLALADHMRGEDNVTACFFGDGAVAEGEFHESLNLAALWALPVLFVCENNLYAHGHSAWRLSESETDIQRKAAGYRIASEAVDGMDVVAVEAAARRAVQAVREDRQALFPGVPHLPVARPFHVRRPALPRQGRSRGLAAEESRSCASADGCRRTT